jgi:hypothetical protein
MPKTVMFSVNFKGEDSTQYQGVFQAKTSLSVREVLREDEIRRTILGFNPQDASQYQSQLAAAVAYLSIRLTGDVPDWWARTNNGLDVNDEIVLAEVNNACTKEIQKTREEFLKKAEDEAKALKNDNLGK